MTPLEVLLTVLLLCVFVQMCGLMVLRRSVARLRRRVAKLHGRNAAEMDALEKQMAAMLAEAKRLTGGPTKEDMDELRTTLIDRKRAEVLVGRINEISKDMMALKVEVGNLTRHANAIGMKKMIAGIVPRPTEDPPKESA